MPSSVKRGPCDIGVPICNLADEDSPPAVQTGFVANVPPEEEASRQRG